MSGGIIDETLQEFEKKKRKDSHYRLTRAESANVTVRKARGYENVSPQDPEIKGTILEKETRGDGTVRVGNLILQRIPKEQHEKLKKEVEDRTRRMDEAIKRKFLEDGEQIKRSLGSKHKHINFIHESEKE